MNNERRKLLSKALDLVAEARELVANAAIEERDAYDNMPENLQGSEKVQAMEENATALDQIESDLEDQETAIRGIIE